MLKQLRRKFICINMVFVLIALLVLFGILLTTTSNRLKDESLRMLQMADEFQPPKEPGREVPENESRRNSPHFTLSCGSDGSIQASGRSIVDFDDKDLLEELWNIADSSEKRTGIIWKHELRYLQAPSGKIAFCDISTQITIMNNLFFTCLTTGILVLLLFFFISVFLARWSVKPVEKAWEQQKRFIADASHELKTPLTVITTNAELLYERCDQVPESQYAENVLSMSRQMRGLTEGLLDLAKLDRQDSLQNFVSVDLSRLAEEAILPFEVIFFEKELMFQSDLEENIQVMGDAISLRRLMDILLDNAQKYSKENSEVLFTLKRSGYNQCQLSVQTRGDTLSKKQLSQIFQRFYRCDEARPMNHSYGLGLSIAQGIAEEHRGKIWAQSKDGVNTFFVQLPTA